MGERSIRFEDGRYTGVRIDKFVADELKLFSRSQIPHRNLTARLNGKEVKLSRTFRVGDLLELRWDEELEEPRFAAEAMELSVLYEDERVVVIDKPQGLVVHPGDGNRSGTLVQGLLHHVRTLGERFGTEAVRPGIVHRLDKDTSGVIIAAKDPATLEFLAAQFKERQTRKTYFAIVKGTPKRTKGRIETMIARDPRNRKRFAVRTEEGKLAITHWRVVRSFGSYSLVLLRPETGRTHQLRVHARYAGWPILGDELYSRKDQTFPEATLMLHAASLVVLLPGEDEPRRFVAPLPERFREIIGTIKGDRAERDELELDDEA